MMNAALKSGRIIRCFLNKAVFGLICGGIYFNYSGNNIKINCSAEG